MKRWELWSYSSNRAYHYSTQLIKNINQEIISCALPTLTFVVVHWQTSSRKALESSLRQLEREKALLQHKTVESHRKAESEADRKRCLENEGETAGWTHTHTHSILSYLTCDVIFSQQPPRPAGRYEEKKSELAHIQREEHSLTKTGVVFWGIK